MSVRRPGSRLDPKSRIGYDAHATDLERLDEKLDAIDDLPPELFVKEPRAVRQAQKVVWDKPRKGRPR